MYCCKPREEEYITAGDWVKAYLPAHAVLFFIVPEDNEGAKALINNAPELSKEQAHRRAFSLHA